MRKMLASIALALTGCATVGNRYPTLTEAMSSGANYEPPKVISCPVFPHYPRYCSVGDIPEYMEFTIRVDEKGGARVTEIDPKPNVCTFDFAREVKETTRRCFFHPSSIDGMPSGWKDTFVMSRNTF